MFMQNVLAIYVAKGKSIVSLISSCGEVLIEPYKINHSINDIYNIVNNINQNVFGITTAWSYFFKDELFWLKNLIKNNEKRHRN